MNQAVLEEGYAALRDGGVSLTDFSDTKLTGTMTAPADGLCYFSIPYDSGWRAEVDGEKAEIMSVGDAMTAIPVSAGMHTVTLYYCPKGLSAGICCTGAVILLLAASYILEKKRGRSFLEPVSVGQKEKDETASTENVEETQG